MNSIRFRVGSTTHRLVALGSLVCVLLGLSLDSPARARATLVAQMDSVTTAPPRIENQRPAIQRIDIGPAVTTPIEPRPRDDQPSIVAPPISSTAMDHREARPAAVERELQRLLRTAESSRNIGSTTQSAQAAWLLGLIYLHGAGVRRDPAVAQRWFEQAARYGREPWAYAGLAWCYIDGCVGPPEPAAAARAIGQLRPRQPARADFLEWVLLSRQAPLQVSKPGMMQDQVLQLSHMKLLEKSAAAGDVHANIELGMNAVANQRYDQAAQYFRRAGPQSPAAQADLRELAARGSSPNEIKAARVENPGAAEALAAARKYHRGEGVPANFSEAMRFYQLAANRGSVDARRMLALISSRPAPGGGINPGWMQQLAYADASTVVPTVGVGGTTHMLQREPTPLYDLLPSFWREQMTLVNR